jgi:hypothetical protein
MRMEDFADSKIPSNLDFISREREKIFSPCSTSSRKGDGRQDTSGPERKNSGVEMKWK